MSDLSRRGFLGSLAAAAAGFALDHERLLWRPGEKRIFLPPAKPTLYTASGLTVGDVITIAGVYAVNPVTQRPVDGYLQQFVVTANVSPGELRVERICPTPIADGAYRNVSSFSGRNRVQPLFVGT